MATPQPEKSVFVAIGAWNPAILQPPWLMKHFPYAVEQKIDIHLTAHPGEGSSMVLDLGKLLLDPNGGRLILVPKALDDDTLSLIARLSKDISKKLEHTPTGAAGCNFVFRLDDSEYFTVDEIRDCDSSQTLYSGIGLKHCIKRSVRHTFSLEDHNLNISFLRSGSEGVIAFNYDYQSPIDAVVSASNALLQNYRHSLDLCAELIRSKP
jgi:hypothetical protein